MQLDKTHHVLCVSCQVPVITLYAYHEQRCGYTALARRPGDPDPVHGSCTNEPGNASCRQGVHYDSYAVTKFGARDRLRSGAQGATGNPG